MTLRMIAVTLALAVACYAAVSNGRATAPGKDETTMQEGRAADATAIRAHIESIFQAFIDGDQDKIFATHSTDWRGFRKVTRSYQRHRRLHAPMANGPDQQFGAGSHATICGRLTHLGF